MDFMNFFLLISHMFSQLFDLLDSLVFTINGFEVSFGGMLFVGFVVFFVVSIFWKGAKT